jgi:hypothetical protein
MRDGRRMKPSLPLECVLVITPLEKWLPWVLDRRRSALQEDVGGSDGQEELLRTLASLIPKTFRTCWPAGGRF